MKEKSIKVNYILNTTNTILGMLFPLITFPYVTRVLSADGIGKVNFANSVCAYFVMLSGLGIPMYGIREVAKVRDNKEKLDKVFSELLIINICTMLISLAIYFLVLIFVDKIRSEMLLFSIMSISIFLSPFSVEWLYQGTENYKYITLRSIFFKFLSLILLFIFVHKRKDYIIYAAISVFATSASYILNIFNSKKYVRLQLKNLDIKGKIKPILVFFASTIAIDVYTNMDNVILGFIKSNEAVGYYTAALKPNRIMVSIVVSLGVVLLPRLSYLIKQKNFDEYKKIASKSVQFVFFLSLPIVVGILCTSKAIIFLLAGKEFYEAVGALQIGSLLILAIGLNNFAGIQILISNNEEKKFLFAVIIGAIVNLTLNLMLVPVYSFKGSIISTVIAEFVILFVELIIGREYFKFKFININTLNYVLGSIFIFLISQFIKIFDLNIIIEFIITVLLSGITYFLFLLIRKDEFILRSISLIKSITCKLLYKKVSV